MFLKKQSDGISLIIMLLLWATIITVSGLSGQDMQTQYSPNRTQGGNATNTMSGYYSAVPEKTGSEMEYASPDNSLDENTYYIGGGDVFRVYLSDMPSISYLGIVNENGDLYLRSLGILTLGKISLAHAREMIIDFVKLKLRNQKAIHVALVKVKINSFTLSGSVMSPGTYSLPGYLRIWDAIKTTNKYIGPQEGPGSAMATPVLTSYLRDNDFRSVTVRHKDNSIEHFDLLPFLLKGDLSQNPYIYPGDQIMVSPATSCVYIEGAINDNLKHYVPIIPNEKASDFLSLFTLDPNADSEHISISRTNDSNRSENNIISLKQKSDFILRNNDIITVHLRKDASEIGIVYIKGEIARPGYYPISKNKTTIQDILTEAGSYTAFANIGKAAIIRRSNLPTELFSHGTREDVREPLAAMRPELSSALFMMNATKDYTVILVEKNPTTILQPGDEIYVPRAGHTVYVSGSVQHPGAYSFSPGKDIKHYINLAGGYTSRSNKDNITIAAVYGDAFQTPNRNIIEDGDVIIVPLAQQYKFLSTVIMPIASLFFASAGFLIGVISLIRR